MGVNAATISFARGEGGGVDRVVANLGIGMSGVMLRVEAGRG